MDCLEHAKSQSFCSYEFDSIYQCCCFHKKKAFVLYRANFFSSSKNACHNFMAPFFSFLFFSFLFFSFFFPKKVSGWESLAHGSKFWLYQFPFFFFFFLSFFSFLFFFSALWICALIFFCCARSDCATWTPTIMGT